MNVNHDADQAAFTHEEGQPQPQHPRAPPSPANQELHAAPTPQPATADVIGRVPPTPEATEDAIHADAVDDEHHHHRHQRDATGSRKDSGSCISDGRDADSGDAAPGGPQDADVDEAPQRRLTRTERDEAELKALFSRSVYRISFFLWLLGLINNFHYNMVISGANALASSFGMTRYVALISFMNVFFGIIARIMNAFVAHRISYNIRMTLMSSGTIVGLLIVSFAGDMGRGNDTASFVVLLIGVAFTGTAYSYGETVALSFVQRYPPHIVGAWGSGTGISGVITALLFIGLTSAGLSIKVIFLITLPLAVVYWLVFTLGLVAPHKVVTVTYLDGSRPPEAVVLHRGFEARKMEQLEALGPDVAISDYTYAMLMNLRGLSWRTVPAPSTTYGHLPGRNVVHDEDTAYAPAADAMDEVERENEDGYKPDDLHFPCCRFLCGCCSRRAAPRRWWGRNGYVIGLMHNSMIWFFFNLSVVYIAEYAAQFMAPFSFYCKQSWEGSFWVKNSYTITQVCYQLGVFISRSSLMCVKIPWVGVISIIQVINAVGWLVQAKTKFISIHSSESAETGLSFLLFAWMLFVGLLGGASYVNVFFLVLCRGKAMQEREEDELIRRYLERRPAAALYRLDLHTASAATTPTDDSTTAAGAAASGDAAIVKTAPRAPAPREGVVEEASTTASVTGPEVRVRTGAAAAAAASSTTGPEPPYPARPTTSKTGDSKSDEVEGRLAHSDSDDGEENAAAAAEQQRRASHASDADPTLVRLGMADRQLSETELDEIESIRRASAEEWQRRRELGMSMGSLYAMVGICIGTILDVIFTNTFLATKSTCVEG